jgi:putative hydrolase of the HAD superfamily
VEAVIFDWGGTLSHFAEVEMIDMWRLAARHLAPDREDELTDRLVEAEAAFWATTATTQRSGTLAQLLAQASEALHLDVAEAVLEEAAARHLDAWTPHIRHQPHAVPALTALRAMGLRTGMLSNTHWPRDFHEHFLERDGLAPLLDARLYTSHMEFQKPHPSAFLAALDALDVRDPRRAVFVGDRPWDDISGAAAVGMRSVLISNTWAEPADVEPDATIANLGELVPLIEKWAAEGSATVP